MDYKIKYFPTDSVEAPVWNYVAKSVPLTLRIYTRAGVGDPVWNNVKDSVYNFVAEYFHKRTLI